MLTRKPVKGDRITWPGNNTMGMKTIYIVTRTPEGNDDICHIKAEDRVGDGTSTFIWRSPDGLNRLAEFVE